MASRQYMLCEHPDARQMPFDTACAPPSTMAVIQIPCECSICQRGEFRTLSRQRVHPYIGTKTQVIAAEEAESSIKNATITREVLWMILCQSGATLAKRWRRKTPQQRRKFLLAVRPYLCPYADPLLRQSLKGIDEDWDKAVKNWDKYKAKVYKTSHLLPYLNLQTLSEDSSFLLSLMYYRTAHELSSFAVLDAHQMLPAWALGVFLEPYVEGCMTMHGEHYGQWKSLDLGEIHRGAAFSCSKAQLVLTAQYRLMMFLLEVAANILHDQLPPVTWNLLEKSAEENQKATFAFNVKIFSKFKFTPDTTNFTALQGASGQEVASKSVKQARSHWTSASTRHKAQPFLGPPGFPIEQFLDVAQCRLAELQDDLWLLQTDPDFFRQRLTFINRCNEKGIPGLKSPDGWDWMLATVERGVLSPLMSMIDWHDVVSELQHVQKESDKSGDATYLDLPPDYSQALGCLHLMTVNFLKRLRIHLLGMLIASPAFYHKHVCETQSFESSTHIVLQNIKLAGNDCLKGDKIFTLLKLLTEDPQGELSLNALSLMSLLDQSLAGSPRAQSGRVDPFIFAQISDIAVVEQIKTACELHRPYHRIVTPEEACEVDRPYWVRMKAESTLTAKHPLCHDPSLVQRSGYNPHPATGLTLQAIATACQPLSKFQMPEGEKNERWLREVEDARDHLKNVWKEAHLLLEATNDKAGLPQKHRAIFNDILMRQYMAPEFLAMIEEERRVVLQRVFRDKMSGGIETCSLAEPGILTFGSGLCEEASTHSVTSQLNKLTVKVKTRQIGEKNSSIVEAIDKKEISQPPVSPVLYNFPDNAIEIVDLIFPGNRSAKGTVTWTDFLMLMTSLGFGAEACGGSKVMFKGIVAVTGDGGEKAELHRSILLHKPHPDPEMNLEMLRTIGRRFSRRFGWCRDHFARLEKGS